MKETELMVTGAVPLLVKVTVWAALEVPVFWLANESATGLSETDADPTVTATAAELLAAKFRSPV